MRHSRWWWIAAAAGAVGLVVLYLFDPSRHSFYPVCYWKRWTGLNCAGCGCLRATHHLLHGDVAAAFRYNPLLVLAIPVGAIGFARSKFLARQNPARDVESSAVPSYAWAIWLAVLLALFTILRNLPIHALSWLAPP